MLIIHNIFRSLHHYMNQSTRMQSVLLKSILAVAPVISSLDDTSLTYRWETDELVTWGGQNNLGHSTFKAVETVVWLHKDPSVIRLHHPE